MSQNPDDYSYVLATIGLNVLEREAFRLSTTLDADGAPFQGSEVRRAFFTLLTELKAIALDISVKAHNAIVDFEATSRVRPDTGGAGGARLEDYIGESNPLTAVEGSVGVNNEAMLRSSPVYWWWTNEDGYDWRFHEDSDIHGYFNPGASAPGAAPSRTHPLFQATGPKGPAMVPANDIPAREFVKDGFIAAEKDWHTDVRAARGKFIAACRAAVASAPPPVPKGRRRP